MIRPGARPQDELDRVALIRQNSQPPSFVRDGLDHRTYLYSQVLHHGTHPLGRDWS
jgi:hypothetical protein